MIEPMQQDDIEKVAKIWLDAFTAQLPENKDEYSADFDRIIGEVLTKTLGYVYKSENDILGFITGNLISDRSYIELLCVDPNSQGLGIGKQLLEFVQKEKTQLTLHVHQNDCKTIRFYRKNNFKIRTHGALLGLD